MPQCQGITRSGTQCRRNVPPDKIMCFQHGDQHTSHATATTPTTPTTREKKEKENVENNEPDPCPICWSSSSDESWCQLYCAHHFHKRCIEKWRDRQIHQGQTPTCPMCRGEFRLLYPPYESVECMQNREAFKFTAGLFLFLHAVGVV